MKLFKILFCAVILCMGFTNVSLADKPALHGVIVTKSKTGVDDVVIKTTLQVTYGLNPEINHFNIDSTVQAGIVTLKGAVQNQAQKELAITIAHSTDGVTKVIDNIKVDPRTRVGEIPNNFAQKVKDATMTSMVKSKLILSSDTTGLDIKVTTVNNLVTLQGDVKTLDEKEAAERIAIKTLGVSTVKNYLTVNGK